MHQAFFYIDMEYTGRVRGKGYSMVALGACLIGQPEIRFYEELKPIGSKFDIESMKLISQGLNCLKNQVLPTYNPSSEEFNPQAVLGLLEERGYSPMSAMAAFRQWVLLVSPGRPINFVTDRPQLDWDAAQNYFELAGEKNPFTRCIDASELLNNSGFYKGVPIDTSMLETEDVHRPAHNALHDALYGAKIVSTVVKHNRHLCDLFQNAA